MICNFCKSSKLKEKYKIYSNFFNNYILYYKCNLCKSLHQFPLPELDTLKKYYASYYDIKQNMNPGYLNHDRKNIFFKERDKTLKEIGFSKNRLKNKVNVEFGCANGLFLEYLKYNKAENIIGIDISDELLKSIKINNIKLYNGDLSILDNDSVDNLYLFNILEHIPDIDNLISLIKLKLKNEGLILIEVPLCGIISNFFKNKWRFLMPYEHLHIPSLKGLLNLLNKNGFKLIGKTRFGSGFTTGMINTHIKNILDKFVKLISMGDRGSFLFKYKKI